MHLLPLVAWLAPLPLAASLVARVAPDPRHAPLLSWLERCGAEICILSATMARVGAAEKMVDEILAEVLEKQKVDRAASKAADKASKS